MAMTQAFDFIRLIQNTADLVCCKAVNFLGRICDTSHHTACYTPKETYLCIIRRTLYKMEATSDLIRLSFITRILSQKPFPLISNTPKLQVLEIQDVPQCTPITNKDYSLAKASTLALVPSGLLVTGYLVSIPGVKQLKHEADHSTPSTAELGTSGAIHLLPHIPSWHGLQELLCFNTAVLHLGHMQNGIYIHVLGVRHTQVKGYAVLNSGLKSLYYT